MLIYSPEVYKSETHIVSLYSDWQALPYCRLGIATSDDGKIGTTSARPYRLVIAYAAVRAGQGFVNRIHRIAYLNVAGAPDHIDGIDPDYESDNLIVPSSFIAGEPLTTEPTKFGLPECGHIVNLKNRWQTISDWKCRWDRHCQSVGVAPLETSVEKWGVTYD